MYFTLLYIMEGLDTDKKGFTLLETTVTIAVLVFIFALSAPMFRSFQAGLDAQGEARNIIGTIRYAQNKTLASEGSSQYGVYFSTSTVPQYYTIFRGTSYSTRDAAYDIVRELSDIEISGVDFSGGAEIIFQRISGLTDQPGSLSGYLAADPSKSFELYVNKSGQASTEPFPAASLADSRLADARHVHFDYSRAINIATSTSEHLFMQLGTTTVDIKISDFLSGNNLDYSGNISVNGDNESITVRTIRLNDPDTLFCVYRECDTNNIQLDIDLSGDLGLSPNLISFSADGLTTATGTSIFVGGPEWQ